MTAQEIFDTVVRHLFTQGAPALLGRTDETGQPICAYRAKDGSRCAFGVLIPDERYRKGMENQPAYTLISNPEWELEEFKPHATLISALQRDAHDHPDNWMDDDGNRFNRDRLAERLRRIARDFHLSDAVVGEMEASDENA